MGRRSKENQVLFLLVVGLLAWLVPGAGHFVLKEKKRAIIIFATIVLTFCVGIYAGSIGVIDPVGAWWWYVAQIMNSPMDGGGAGALDRRRSISGLRQAKRIRTDIYEHRGFA